jgi:hypothetical protein
MSNKYAQYLLIPIIKTIDMKNTDTQISTDLQKFIEKFEPNKFKLLARGIEIRGNNDVYRSITFAKELIERMKLKLTVHHSAEMAMYGGFEVVNS